jgi:putative endonuclease
MYSTYILWSEKLQKYYVGHTDNLSRRITEHNTGKSTYTKLGKPWSLAYHEEFTTKAEAMGREREIKHRKSRRYIESIINRAI